MKRFIQKIAALIAASVEIFFDLERMSVFHSFVIFVTAGMIADSILIGIVIAVSERFLAAMTVFIIEVATTLIVAAWKKSKKMFLWQMSNWLYDKPVWAGVEIYLGAKSIVFLMLFAVAINFAALVCNKEKEDWTLWGEGVNFLKKSQESVFWFFLEAAVFFGILFSESFLSGCIVFLLIFAVGGIFQLILFGLKISWLEDVIMFFILSLFQDSFVATTYLKHGRNNGLQARDYAIFLASSVVSVSYWAFQMGIIVEVGRSLLGL